jgi:hypothetical protein
MARKIYAWEILKRFRRVTPSRSACGIETGQQDELAQAFVRPASCRRKSCGTSTPALRKEIGALGLFIRQAQLL